MKLDVLVYIQQQGQASSADVADAFGWTVSGAASTLLRLHRHGHLRRRRAPAGFVYWLARKGAEYIEWVGREG